MEANDPQEGGQFGLQKINPWGRGIIMVSRMYVGDHWKWLYTKYISCGPHGFREEVFFILIFHFLV